MGLQDERPRLVQLREGKTSFRSAISFVSSVQITALSAISSSRVNQDENQPQFVSILLNLHAEFPQPAALQRMVRFLDEVVPHYMASYLPATVRGPNLEAVLARRIIGPGGVRAKTLLKFIHKLRQASGLDESAVPNAIFVRKMNDLHRVNKECRMHTGEQAERFHQKVFHLMEDSSLMHFAVLKFFARENLHLAVYFAVFCNVAPQHVPPELSTKSEEVWAETRERVESE